MAPTVYNNTDLGLEQVILEGLFSADFSGTMTDVEKGQV